jgi:hypothetical protein
MLSKFYRIALSEVYLGCAIAAAKESGASISDWRTGKDILSISKRVNRMRTLALFIVRR